MRHGTLDTIATIWQFFGITVTVLGFIAGVLVALSGNQVGVGIALSISSLFSGLLCFTIAGLISAVIDIEYNTRKPVQKREAEPEIGGAIAARMRNKQ